MNWLELMEREGAFSETEGDRLGAGISRAELDELTEADVMANIARQKSKGVKRENLRLIAGERMVAGEDQRYNEETKEYEHRSLIDRDQGVEGWHRFKPMSAATIRKMFWRVM